MRSFPEIGAYCWKISKNNFPSPLVSWELDSAEVFTSHRVCSYRSLHSINYSFFFPVVQKSLWFSSQAGASSFVNHRDVNTSSLHLLTLQQLKAFHFSHLLSWYCRWQVVPCADFYHNVINILLQSFLVSLSSRPHAWRRQKWSLSTALHEHNACH